MHLVTPDRKRLRRLSAFRWMAWRHPRDVVARAASSTFPGCAGSVRGSTCGSQGTVSTSCRVTTVGAVPCPARGRSRESEVRHDHVALFCILTSDFLLLSPLFPPTPPSRAPPPSTPRRRQPRRGLSRHRQAAPRQPQRQPVPPPRTARPHRRHLGPAVERRRDVARGFDPATSSTSRARCSSSRARCR